MILEIGTENIAILLQDNYICVQKNGGIIKSIPLRDIRDVMVTAKNVLLGQNLLQSLAASNIPFVVLDENFLPVSFLFPCNVSSDKEKALERQAALKPLLRKKIWQSLIAEKIKNRSKVLCSLNKQDIFSAFDARVLLGDEKNVNATSAKPCFCELFGKDFVRKPSSCGANAFIAYGYTQLRLLALRYIWSLGLNPFVGLNPNKPQSYLGLTEDLIEPYKPLVDKCVSLIFSQKNADSRQVLSAEYKAKLSQILNKEYYDGGQLKSLFELIRRTVNDYATSIRKNEANFTFSKYLIEVKNLKNC